MDIVYVCHGNNCSITNKNGSLVGSHTLKELFGAAESGKIAPLS